MVDLGLKDKTVVVAGSGQGIGLACAQLFADVGAHVVGIDNDAERAAATGAHVADVTERADVERVIGELDRVDVLVDIIGMARWGRVLDMGDDDWDASFDLVLRHAYYLSQAAGRRMVEQGDGGAMVFVTSVSGLASAPRHGAYGAAKAGLMSLVRTLAIELAADGIRVNSVAPGAVRTPRVLAVTTEERLAESAKSIPLGRQAEPAEIAAAVLFLASGQASYITGQTLVVDGGATAKFPLSVQP
ncbi:MAG TPA: SDR family NAD(P)-dependent oxidoreductase [Acidimicrobiales bacterium]|nr:SDR family NAD(P)-dependent oxidoreductase [Acidimicrobiales bacterium]